MSHPIRKRLTALPALYTHEDADPANVPTVKVFNPSGAATWWLSEYGLDDPTDPESGVLFGLCDLGMGFPELGYVSLADLEAVRGQFGLPVEIDRHWTGTLADAKKAAGI